MDGEFIKQLFTRWDRSLLTDEQFKHELYMHLGCHPSREIDRLLTVHGPSRNLSFGKLMHVLQSSHFRPQIPPAAVPHAPEPCNSARPQGRNPAHWSRNPPLSAVDELQGGTRADRINYVLSQFIDGNTTSKQFRHQLQQCQVPISDEIERLIRKHESGNSTKYREYAKVIFRNDEYVGLSKVDGAVPQTNSSLNAPYAASDVGAQGYGTERDRKYAEEYSNRGSEVHRRPWATLEDLQSAPKHVEFSPARKGKFKGPSNGDIIAWSDQGSTIEPSDSASNFDADRGDRFGGMAPGWRTNGDIIGWSTNDASPQDQRKSVSGKRIVGDSEVGKRPFGTENDGYSDQVDDSVMTNAQKYHARMRRNQALHGVLA